MAGENVEHRLGLRLGSQRRGKIGRHRHGVGHVELRESPDLEEVLTLDEAAAMLRVPVQALIRRVEMGELPGRRFGEEWRFSREALLNWLAAGETANQAPAGLEEDVN